MRHVRIVSKGLPKRAVDAIACEECIDRMRNKGKEGDARRRACERKGDC